MLTSKQHDLLMFIHNRLKDTGVPPSFEEMKEALGLKSKSGIHRLITALEERGFLRRLAHRARALEIVKMPEDRALMGEEPVVPKFKSTVVEGAFNKVREAENTGLLIPMMGKIAAGVPIEAISDHSADISIPPDMLGKGEHFALEVKGDSMINAGILDGDTVLIKKGDTARNGDIVVALVDNEEATLKRLRKKGGSIALEAANPAYETRVFGPDRVQVQGTLSGLLRRY